MKERIKYLENVISVFLNILTRKVEEYTRKNDEKSTLVILDIMETFSKIESWKGEDMDLDYEELKATNPNALEKENKLLRERVKQLELDLQFYKEVYYGKENYQD